MHQLIETDNFYFTQELYYVHIYPPWQIRVANTVITTSIFSSKQLHNSI